MRWIVLGLGLLASGCAQHELATCKGPLFVLNPGQWTPTAADLTPAASELTSRAADLTSGLARPASATSR